MKRILPLLCALALSGCAYINAEAWPDEGRGGLAEWTPIGDDKVRELSMRLSVAKERNAEYYAAADLVEAESLLKRVRREVEGELYIDADKDIAALETVIVSIERQVTRRGRARERIRG